MRTNHGRSRWTLTFAAAALAAAATPALAADTDSDGLEDLLEIEIGTNPALADTDGDGWDDYEELFVQGTDPTLADTDGDGLADALDPDPFVWPSGDPDGVVAATFAGARTGTPWARSGLSPQDGEGVLLHDGTVRLEREAARAAGVNGLDHVLRLAYDSRSLWDGRHGTGWTSALDTWRTVDGSGNVTLHWDGVAAVWTKSGSTFVPPAGFVAAMTDAGSGNYVVTWPDGRSLTVGAQGIVSVADRFGNSIQYAWSGGRPVSATDSRGQVHTLEYWTTGRLRKITAADGAAWSFEYNVEGQLYRIKGPATASFPSGIATEYRYVNGSSVAALNGNLVAAADGKGQWWLRCEYDAQDRVTKQFVGGTAAHYAFDHSQASSQIVTVTDRAGNERVWKWDAAKLTRTELTERTNRNVRAGEGDYVTTWTTDADGYLATVTWPRGNGIRYTRNAAKLATEERRKAVMAAADGPGDLVRTRTYDPSRYHGLTSETDPCGNTTTFSLDTSGRPVTVTFPTVTNVTPNVTATNSYTYDASGPVASFTDGEGKVVSFQYYSTGPRKGRLWKRIDDAAGLALTTTWDYAAWGDVTSVTDPRGNTTTSVVERYGNVTRVSGPSPLGYVTEYAHDANLNVVTRRVKNVDHDGTWLTSPAWWTTSTTWTVMNRPATFVEDVTASTTRTTTCGYDANDALISVARAGRETRIVRDERGLPWRRTLEGGAAADVTEEWTYDGNRNETLHADFRGKSLASEFDAHDRSTKTVDPLGHYELRVVDPLGRVTERLRYEEAGTTDVLLAHHRQSYDEAGRIWKEEDALLGGGTTWLARTYAYDRRNLLTSVTDRRNQVTSFGHDGAGRRTSRTDALGNAEQYTLDACGNVTRRREIEVVPGSSSTETYDTDFVYDAAGRMTSRTETDRTNASNQLTTEWRHGALGLRKETDPRGNDVVYVLDGLGRVVQRTEDVATGVAAVTSRTLNVHDEVTSLTDDNGHDTAWTWDSFGRLASKTYENGKSVSFLRDANGNVTRITDQNGTVIDQTYDDAGRLVARDVTPAAGVGGDTAEDFAWDALGRLTEAKDGDSIVQFTYDSLSRVLTEKQGPNPFGSSAKTVSFTWDAEGNRTRLDYPSGFVANEARDALGRLSSVTDGSSAAIASFALHGAGLRAKETTFGNGTRTVRTWDGFRRAAAIDHRDPSSATFASFAYLFDASGNPLCETRSHQGGAGDVYAYDEMDRLIRTLTGVADPAAEIASPGSETYDAKLEYDQDEVLNLTAYRTTPYGGSASTTTYTTDAMNQYTAVGATSLSWTDAGSLANDGTLVWKYDWRQRPVEVKLASSGATVATYAWDCVGLGRRIGRTAGSVTTRWVHAGDQAIEEYEGGSLARLLVFGDRTDDVLAMDAADRADADGDSNTTEVLRFSFHGQLLGSVTHVTAPSGAVAERYEYDPWGAPTIRDAGGTALSGSAIGNPYLFTGRQLDEETGTYHYRARQYSAALRRFLQRDPLEYVDGPNALAYCRNAPTANVDPTGCDGIHMGQNGGVTVKPDSAPTTPTPTPGVRMDPVGPGTYAPAPNPSVPKPDLEDRIKEILEWLEKIASILSLFFGGGGKAPKGK